MAGVYGLRGWQWLFLLEGIPAVLLGFVTLLYVVDKPEQANWLSATEKNWLKETMKKEQDEKALTHGLTLWQTLKHPRVWQLCLLYFSVVISFYGVAFWLPQIVKSFSGLGNSAVAVLSAVPYVSASICMVLIANHSDKVRERRWHIAVPAFAGCVGLGLAVFFLENRYPLPAFFSICLAASGIWSTLGPFWSLPTAFLTGTAAAGGVALINSIGNVGGFIGPYVIGYIRQTTQSFTGGMLVLAATLLIAGFLALRVKE
jgi:sugar phosphate permease